MSVEKLTCRQYVIERMNEYKESYYYKKVLELKKTKPDLSNSIIESKENKYIEEWKNYILEYGKTNKLNSKIIYSYIREFGHQQLLYDFRRVRALEGWIPSERYTIGL